MMRLRNGAALFDGRRLVSWVDPEVVRLLALTPEEAAPGVALEDFCAVAARQGFHDVDGRLDGAGLLRRLLAAAGEAMVLGVGGGAALQLSLRAHPGGWTLLVSDVSALFAMRTASTAPADLLAAALDLLPATVSIKDVDRRYLFVNRAWVAMTGATPTEALGRTFEDIAEAHPGRIAHDGYLDEVRRRDVQTLETLAPVLNREERYVRADGEVIALISDKIPLRDSGGRPLGMVSVTRDVTALRRAREAAERALAAKTRFIRQMSHELRTPLNAINGFAALLADEVFGPHGDHRYGEFAQHMLTAARGLERTFANLDDLFALDAGDRSLCDEWIPLQELLDEAATHAAHLTLGRGVAVEVAAPDLDVLIRADRDALRRVVGALLENAALATPEGGRLLISAAADAAGAVFAVADDGPGAPEEVLPHLFDPFDPVSADMRERHGVCGLSLAVAQRLMRLHDGGLTLTLRPEGGALAALRLPPERVAPPRL